MKPNYGIDAPVALLYLFIAGAGSLLISFVPGLPDILVTIFRGFSAIALAHDLVLFLGSKVFKLTLRDRLLNSLKLSGNERALDMGCGRGLMLIGLAKRLPNGSAVGIDNWKGGEKAHNTEAETRKNAKAEKVEDKIEIFTGNMKSMPFDHQSFDLVVSSWSLHDILAPEDRDSAIIDAVRVLKPGGRLVIVDFLNIKQYVEMLNTLQLTDIKVSSPNFLFLIPTQTIQATKPQRINVDKNLTLS